MASTWVPPEQYVKKLPMHAQYACVFFTDTEDRPLQLRSSVPATRGTWQWPGGNTDIEGESPFETAVRECREETGIAFTGPPRLLAMFWTPPAEWPVAKVGFCFDGGRLSDDVLERITLDPDEHDQLAVRSMTEWAKALTAREWERLAAVMGARNSGLPVYLELRETDGR
ncbi:NUDIX domain-containing protein [Streptomyces chattanoogensis]|uniref:NUDIX domain-containing protein n=1 Tax=Streptomyces chattanoogensis TaxID=66876 RepID=UPI0036AF2E37